MDKVDVQGNMDRDELERIEVKYFGGEGTAAPTPWQMIENPHVILQIRAERIQIRADTGSGLAPLT
jgi:hypothetical protein